MDLYKWKTIFIISFIYILNVIILFFSYLYIYYVREKFENDKNIWLKIKNIILIYIPILQSYLLKK